MKRYLFLIFSLFSCGFALAEELLVIGHPSIELNLVDKKQLVDIYMGRTSILSNGKKILPLDLHNDSPLRKNFYLWLVNKSTNEINAYWAKLLFSGRATPPYSAASSAEIIDVVSKNPTAIGYIHKSALTDKVKIIRHVQ